MGTTALERPAKAMPETILGIIQWFYARRLSALTLLVIATSMCGLVANKQQRMKLMLPSEHSLDPP